MKSASGCEGDFLLESDFLFENKKSDSSKKSTWISMPRLVPFYHLLGNKKYPVICILLKEIEPGQGVFEQCGPYDQIEKFEDWNKWPNKRFEDWK